MWATVPLINKQFVKVLFDAVGLTSIHMCWGESDDIQTRPKLFNSTHLANGAWPSYSVSLVYRARFFGSVPLLVLGTKQLWKVSAPPRWSISFGFHCRIGAVQQNDVEWHNLQDDDRCALCDQGSETMDHIMIGCVFSQESVGWLCWGAWTLVTYPLGSGAHVWNGGGCRPVSSCFANSGKVSIIWPCWFHGQFWKERNNRTFNGVASSWWVLSSL